ncbi:CDGSH iron-sulfur domain-containing protein [Patiriisocius marinus]|uniref:CDGSH iron-sulfur domain-containing protein n=1 Tax=Patiriisocius marinus TaxID=1397112 RepID=UPI00124F1E69|nr:CDGSH iron-sulfur domain-containing protein [Patiriisocius marinus]
MAKVNLIENGPLVVVVEMTITHEDRTTDVKDTRASFCRCGKSENMPFCNGAHKGEL